MTIWTPDLTPFAGPLYLKLVKAIEQAIQDGSLPPQTRLHQGIYAVQVGGIGPELRNGVASFGTRPTFDDGALILETFIFDFDGDLYGREIEVVFHAFLRPEKKFDSAEALVEQMNRDALRARAELAVRTQ